MRFRVLISAPSARSHSSDGARVVLGMLWIAGGKLHLISIEAEGLEHGVNELDAAFDLSFQLVAHAEDVRIVLGEAANAQQAVHHAGALEAINGAEFREAHGQLAITAQARLVNQNVARAIHGLELVLGLFDVHGRQTYSRDKSWRGRWFSTDPDA